MTLSLSSHAFILSSCFKVDRANVYNNMKVYIYIYYFIFLYLSARTRMAETPSLRRINYYHLHLPRSLISFYFDGSNYIGTFSSSSRDLLFPSAFCICFDGERYHGRSTSFTRVLRFVLLARNHFEILENSYFFQKFFFQLTETRSTVFFA